MTRIIAGRAGSLVLDVPGSGTRPTSDRVRESLFGALESADLLRGAAVLDLYAGSGALGLEAASRGAASVDLVERAGAAAAVVRRNVAKVARAIGEDAALRVHATAVKAFLHGASGSFDLVFIDPPYREATQVASRLDPHLARILAPGGRVVAESDNRGPLEFPSLETVRERRYGRTVVTFHRLFPSPDLEPSRPA